MSALRLAIAIEPTIASSIGANKSSKELLTISNNANIYPVLEAKNTALPSRGGIGSILMQANNIFTII